MTKPKNLPKVLQLIGGSESESEVVSDSFATPWTVAYQASLSIGFSQQEYQSGLPFPSPGIFPTQELNPGLLHAGRHFMQN